MANFSDINAIQVVAFPSNDALNKEVSASTGNIKYFLLFWMIPRKYPRVFRFLFHFNCSFMTLLLALRRNCPDCLFYL